MVSSRFRELKLNVSTVLLQYRWLKHVMYMCGYTSFADYANWNLMLIWFHRDSADWNLLCVWFQSAETWSALVSSSFRRLKLDNFMVSSSFRKLKPNVSLGLSNLNLQVYASFRRVNSMITIAETIPKLGGERFTDCGNLMFTQRNPCWNLT